MKLEELFVCRGTERLQVPVQAPASSEFPLRKTVSQHCQSGEICEPPNENWHILTRAKRIRNHVPSKLNVDSFWHPTGTSTS